MEWETVKVFWPLVLVFVLALRKKRARRDRSEAADAAARDAAGPPSGSERPYEPIEPR